MPEPEEEKKEEDDEKRKFITTEELTEAMGGKDVVAKDKRLNDLIWQCNLLLDNKIHFQDFVYIVQFTDTAEQQKSQLDTIKRYLKKMKKTREIQAWQENAKV